MAAAWEYDAEQRSERRLVVQQGMLAFEDGGCYKDHVEENHVCEDYQYHIKTARPRLVQNRGWMVVPTRPGFDINDFSRNTDGHGGAEEEQAQVGDAPDSPRVQLINCKPPQWGES